jgi:hypothetical protein
VQQPDGGDDDAQRGVFDWMRRPQGERIDLGGDVSALCLARTGANPVRPHMIAVSPTQTHVIVSFVASGHVLFIDAQGLERADIHASTVRLKVRPEA